MPTADESTFDLAALLAVERRLAAVEAQLAKLVEFGERVELVLAKIEPTVDDLRPVVDGLMAGKVGRIIRTLSERG